MKNFKKTFAVLLIVYTALSVFPSCKKNNDFKKDDEKIDLTKYYITGEIVANAISTSYVYIFLPLAKKRYNSLIAGSIDDTGNYKYSDGLLTTEDVTFNIVNGSIIKSSLPNLFKSHHLQKIPDADAFAGKMFKGTIATNGINIGKSCVIKFTNTSKFTVSIDGFSQIGNGADYTLQNNGVATANTGLEGRLHLMTMSDGKLYYSQLINQTNYFGLLSQQ